MRIHRDFDTLGSIKNPVVTTGTFDGVHIGHKVIVDRLNTLAKKIKGESVLITFHPHPRIVLYPESAGKKLQLINSQKEKIQLFEKTGLDHLVIINFTKEFAQTTSQQFVEEILLGKLHAKIIIVGFNHHFGHNREGDYSYLYELTKTHDFKVEEIPEQDLENETVSSTIIRKALSEGRVQRANAYLDHFFIMTGLLKEGAQKCKEIGFPTLELIVEEDVKLIPPEGVYAISLNCNQKRYRGMLNIKIYADSDRPGIQVHLFDYDTNFKLIHKEVTLTFHKRMRDELQINDAKDLKYQLELDKAEIEELIY
ncbi:MAG TPA: riboflavin biosynthesis protein RibF [Bacteroidales bacterium]|jgi:riboflavin kinase/FMN adenylyltransferase|nr:riboflavin biosynthesis protein RibF [Bacteroidales bacterium]